MRNYAKNYRDFEVSCDILSNLRLTGDLFWSSNRY